MSNKYTSFLKKIACNVSYVTSFTTLMPSGEHINNLNCSLNKVHFEDHVIEYWFVDCRTRGSHLWAGWHKTPIHLLKCIELNILVKPKKVVLGFLL